MIDILDEKNWPDELWLKAHNVLYPTSRAFDGYRACNAKTRPLCRNLIRHQLSEGYWTLPDPLEQVRKDAREAFAVVAEQEGLWKAAKKYREGDFDHHADLKVAVALLAKERGIEVPE